MSKFSDSDIELLMEALDALEKKDVNDAFTTGLLGAMLTKDKDERMNDFEKTMNDAQEKSKGLKNRIILLKAKLIQMQDEMLVSEAKIYAEGKA